jgi:ABC-type multidrug transport system fused ATPase/permease subunit
MEVEVNAEAKDKRLNRMVALTVVALSIIMGLGQVKDGNIVQAMQQAQSDAVDHWNEYQATKTKLHLDEVALAQNAFLETLGGPKIAAATAAERDRLTREMAKYQKEIPELKKQAEGDAAQYDALNVHDDQFDASDAFLSIAISIAAVAALAEAMWALYAAWAFGALGILMSAAGFFGWSLHWDFVSKLLS